MAQPNRDETARDTRASTATRLPGWWPADGSRRRRQNPVTELGGRTGKTDRQTDMAGTCARDMKQNRFGTEQSNFCLHGTCTRLKPASGRLYRNCTHPVRNSVRHLQAGRQPFRVRPS